MKEIQFLDENQKHLLGKTFLDFSKIVLGATIASEFFHSVPSAVSIAAYIIFGFSLAGGVWLNRKEKK